MKGAGPQILGTGAKFKQVPCQKNCRVNRAQFSIYTTKMKVAGPQILGTGAKFKRVPCQKSCRVNRAEKMGIFFVPLVQAALTHDKIV